MRFGLAAAFVLVSGWGCHADTQALGPNTPQPTAEPPGVAVPTTAGPAQPGTLPGTAPSEPPAPPTEPPFEPPDTPPLLISSYQESGDIFGFDPNSPTQEVRLTPADPTQYGLYENTSASPIRCGRRWRYLEVYDGYIRALFEVQPGAEPRFIRSRSADLTPSTCSDDGSTEAWIQGDTIRVQDLTSPDHVAVYSIPDHSLSRASLRGWADGAFLLLIPQPGGFEPWSVPRGGPPIALPALVPPMLLTQKLGDSFAYIVDTPTGADLVTLKSDGQVFRFAFPSSPDISRHYTHQSKVAINAYGEGSYRPVVINLELGTKTEFVSDYGFPDGPQPRTAETQFLLLRGSNGMQALLDMQTERIRPIRPGFSMSPTVFPNPAKNLLLVTDYNVGGLELLSTPDGSRVGFLPTPPGWIPHSLSVDGTWLHLYNSSIAAHNHSMLLNIETGKTQTPSSRISGFLGQLAIISDNAPTRTLFVRKPDGSTQALAEDLPENYGHSAFDSSHRRLLTADTGEIRIIEPLAETPEICRANLPGFEVYHADSPSIWLRRTGPEHPAYAVIDTTQTPCRISQFNASGYGYGTPQRDWGSMFFNNGETITEATKEGLLRNLSPPLPWSAQFLDVPSDHDAIWVLDGYELLRMTRDLEVSRRGTIDAGTYPKIHVAGRTAFIATGSWGETPSVRTVLVQGSTQTTQLPEEAGWYWSRDDYGVRPIEPTIDNQGRLLALTPTSVKAFSSTGEETLLLESELHPPIALFVDEYGWYAPTEGGIWLGTATGPQWLAVPEATSVSWTRSLSPRYLLVLTQAWSYVLDTASQQIIRSPEGVFVHQHLDDERFLCVSQQGPVVWDQATGQVQPILPPSPAISIVEAVLR